jgi:predicted SAM-dependent methyltransferase
MDNQIPVSPSVSRVQVGCGPKNLLEGWCNVDIRNFPGVDMVMDVTQPWPWSGELDYVYGEHFLEHIDIGGALRFLESAGRALREGGRLRLSTPSLEWVLKTHFRFDRGERHRLYETFAINRAFHGWGHRFLYSKPILEATLAAVGYRDLEFFNYGESHTPQLRGLERHGEWRIEDGYPSVWIVEAVRESGEIKIDQQFSELVVQHFVRYVESGH